MEHTNRIKWTDKDIENGIAKVVDFLEIERMPSRREIDDFYGNHALSNKISRTGGFFFWANKLGLQVKESESKLGISLEHQVMEMLKDMGFKCEMTATRYPYDLLVDNCVKIDVKAARKSKVGSSDVYSFRIAKPQQTCDVYIAICLSESKTIERVYVIPSIVLSGKKQLCIGAGHSSYDTYINRWDFIEQMATAFKQISCLA